MDKFLIAGLGNIGEEYDNTRHNIGFKIVDTVLQVEHTAFDELQGVVFCSRTFS